MIYPEVFPESRKEYQAEEVVYNQLSLLHEIDFDVFYNRKFSGRVQGERIDYEIDFIVADLRKGRFNGLICIEVKGGILKYRSDHRWTQNGRLLEAHESPDEQAASGLRSLVKRRFSAIERSLYYGWVLCFPDGGDFSNSELPASLGEHQVVGKSKLTWIDKTIADCFDHLRDAAPDRRGIDISDYNRLFKAPLIRDFSFVLPLKQGIDANEQVFIRLTSEQGRALKMVAENRKVLVRGIAGSGKTILAREIAQESAEKGLKVLFLCYNRVLALNNDIYFRRRNKGGVNSFLRDFNVDNDGDNATEKWEHVINQLAESRASYGKQSPKSVRIRVERYHSFASSVIERAEPGWWHSNFRNDEEFWGFYVPEKVEEIYTKGKLTEFYDVIIIDEGQDFYEDWFRTAEYNLKPDGRFYIFMDEFQNINFRCSRVPDEDEFARVRLSENCRNTKHIAEKLTEIIGQNIPSMPGIPAGEKVRIVRFENDTDQQKKILDLLKSLTGEMMILPSKILVMLSTEYLYSCLSQAKKAGSLPIRKISDNGELSDDCINYSGISSFKGLEADIVMITDTDKVSYDEKILYTQASRAKSMLYIFEKLI